MAGLRLAQGTAVQCYWSALATTPASISARAGAKEAINFIETLLFFVSNHESTSSKQHMN